MRGGKLDPGLMEHDDELHQKGRSGHLLGLLVQERKDVALVVGNQAQPGAEQSLSSHEQEEVCQDQSAAHFQSGNSTGGVTIFVSPHMVSQWYLAVEPPCVLCVWVSFVNKPSSTVGPSIWMCAGIASPPPVRSRIIGARLDLRMVKQMKQQLSKGANELAGSPR